MTIEKTKFHVTLDTSDKDFAEQLRIALDLRQGETLQVVTPQFKRTDGRIITYFPNTPEEYAALPKLPPTTLQKIGCGIWNKNGSKTHWLFPAEWYPHIPAGTLVVDINGESKAFVPGKTDDDRRFGCLAYGFIQELRP